MGKAVKKVTSAATKVVSKAAKAVSSAVSNVVKNPLPVIETVALTAVLGPAGAGLSTATAASISSAAVSAANGAPVQDVAKAAAAGYVGGSLVAPSVGGAVQGAGYSQTTAQIAASASGASTSATLNSLAQGKSLEESLKAGLEGAFVAGATEASIAGVKSALAQGPQEAGEARLKVPRQGNYQLGGDLAQAPQSVGVTDKVPTGGGTGVVVDPSVLYSSRFAPTQPVRGTESGGVQPAYQSGGSLITPAGLQSYTSPYTERPDFVASPLTRSQESLLGEALGLGFGSLFGGDSGGYQTTYSAPQTTKRQITPVAQYSPGSQALGQALRIGDAGSPVFGGDKEEGKKAGWNVESLRYMGDVGEA